MADAVARLDQALSDLVAAHDGVRPVEQGEGDSFVVAFPRASDAAACALQLQRAPLAPIRLRIGLHTGEVRLRDQGNDIGPAINRTARLRDLAHGGQTVMSGITEELVIDQLPVGAWLTSLGSHRLRDLPRPERVVQLCHSDLRNDFTPLRVSETASVQQLPAQFTSFVGRSSQIAEVKQLLMSHRLITLTGAGGAGKTRLAIEVAGRVIDEFGGGVRYVDLAPIAHSELVPTTVARALGLPDRPGSSTVETLVRFIGDRRLLLVLDNCEHLADECAELSVTLLGQCPAMTLLTTSREPIRAPGEITWQVPSLSLADEAIELFIDRARQVRPDFAVTGENEENVTEICRRLEGMPLAIELAAARIRALSLTEILDSLHDRFRLLTGGARTAVRRQQTLRASVDWSHALLTEPEQLLFRRLAVFLGGFDLAAAREIAGGDDIERYQVLDQLTLLVEKSLVVAEAARGRTRYRLLETVRQYALEKLGESGEANAVRTRHRDYYTALAAQLEARTSADHEQRIEQAETEIDNLRAAFAWSSENSDIGLALRLASSLQPLWLTRGHIEEGLGWLATALAGAGSNDSEMRPERARARRQGHASRVGRGHRRERAGRSRRRAHDGARTRRCGPVAQGARGPRVGYGQVAVARLAAGDVPGAWEASKAAEQRNKWQPMTAGAYVAWSAQAALACNDLTAARRLADESVSMARGVYLSLGLAVRARIDVAHGQTRQGERDARQALDVAASRNCHVLVPDILETLARVESEAGWHLDAARLCGAADAARRRMGAVRFKALDADVDACVAVLREELGDNEFDRAWAEGDALSVDGVVACVLRGRGERMRPAVGWASLTPTERDVVRLVGDGLANKDIAARLFVSPRTVESHLTHVYTKLGLSSRVQLAQEAARHELA